MNKRKVKLLQPFQYDTSKYNKVVLTKINSICDVEHLLYNC